MQSGDKVANLSIATSESWKNKNTGERQEKTEWHRVVVFNQGLINIIERYLRKGSKVYLEGQLETRKWTDQSGAEKYSTEVVLRPFRGELTMLDARGSEGGSFQDNRGGQSYDPGPAQGFGGNQGGGQSSAPASQADEFEDEIPF